MSGAPSRLNQARPGRPRDPAVQRQILTAALDIVREGGCAALSMEGVASRAGVSKQSVYRRWSSRGDLLVDLYLGATDQEDATILGETFHQRFESFLSWSVHRLFDQSRANILRALAMEGQADEAVREALRTRIVQPRLAQGRAILLQGMKDGEVRADLDVETALELVFGSVWFGLLISGTMIDENWEKRTLSTFFQLTRVAGEIGNPRRTVRSGGPKKRNRSLG